MPQEYGDFGRRWSELHPSWEVRIWTEEDLDWLENQDLFEKAANRAEQADIARYEVIRREGGFYVDTDFEPLLALDDLLDPRFALIVAEERRDLYGNSFFAAEQGSQFLDDLVGQLRGSLEALPGRPTNEASGPHFFSRSVHRWRLRRGDEFDVRVLSRDALFSLSPRQLREGVRPPRSAIAIHHWAHSWKPSPNAAPSRRTWRARMRSLLSWVKRRIRVARRRWESLEPRREQPVAPIAALSVGDGTVLLNGTGRTPLLCPTEAIGAHAPVLIRGESDPTYRAWLLYLARVLRPWDVVVAIDSGFGLFSLDAARMVGPMGRLLASEADAGLRRLLERNVELNQRLGLQAEVQVFQRAYGVAGHGDAEAGTGPDAAAAESLGEALQCIAEIHLILVPARATVQTLDGLRPLLDEGRVRRIYLHLGNVVGISDWPAIAELLTELVESRSAQLHQIGADGSAQPLPLALALHVDQIDHLIVELPAS